MDTRMTKRWNFSDNFKAAVALQALSGDKTFQEIAAKRQLHPTQVSIGNGRLLKAWQGFSQARSKRPIIRMARSKSCTPRLVSWRWKMIFCHRG